MAKLTPPLSDFDQVTGNRSAKVALVEYGDYQCPECGHAYALVKKLLQEKGEEIQFAFRNFPLQEEYPLAFKAAVSAEAAGRQQQFWEMHHAIFEKQYVLNEGIFLKFATQLNLDTARFTKDVADDEIIQKVEADFESGLRSGVNKTPFFL